MNKFGRGYFGFLRTLVLTSAILFALAIGATSGGANSVAARSIPQVQPTTPHEPPEPDVEKAREINFSALQDPSIEKTGHRAGPVVDSQMIDIVSPASQLIPPPIIVPSNESEGVISEEPLYESLTLKDESEGYGLTVPKGWKAIVNKKWDNTDSLKFDAIIGATSLDGETISLRVWKDVAATVSESLEVYLRPYMTPDVTINEGVLRGNTIYIATRPGIRGQTPSSVYVFLQCQETAFRFEYTSNAGGTQLEPFVELVESFWCGIDPSYSTNTDSETMLPAISRSELVESPTTPTANPCQDYLDPNGNRYPCGQCTWWASYSRPDIPNAYGNEVYEWPGGNAQFWDDFARDHPQFSVSETPEPGSIAVWEANRDGATADGHVAYVTRVNGDGTFNVTDMNSDGKGSLKERPNITDTQNINFILGGVTFFEHINFGGQWFRIRADEPDLTYGGLAPSSIFIPAGWDAIFYRDKNYSTDSWRQRWGTTTLSALESSFWDLTKDNFSDSSNMNDNVRSAQVTKNACLVRPSLITSRHETNEGCGDQPPSGNDTTPPSASGFSASVANGRYAEITTSGVQDNNGGSGVKEVRFSAKWGGNWYGIGTDSSAPYALSWDMCSSGVPNGDVELGMEVWDNAGNSWVWSSRYGNPHITKDSACGGSGNPLEGGLWETQFWMNKYLAGLVNWSPNWLWDDGKWPYIWFDWGIDGPKEGWSGDEFSLRIWRSVYFPGGYYEFRTESDDGVRVYVDGQTVVDRWWDANTGAGGGRQISEGWHEVKVEYYENTGNARLFVVWYGPGYPQPDNAYPDGRISSPTDQSATNSNPLTISAEAWDDASGVDYVEFWAAYCINADCKWRKLAADYSSPYVYEWDWAAYGDQSVMLGVDVHDKAGKWTAFAGGLVDVYLDKTKPGAMINLPLGPNLSDNSVFISVAADDSGSGMDFVQFFAGYNDGSGNYWHDLGSDTNGDDGWNRTWDASAVSDQRDVSFFIYAHDKAGNVRESANWAYILDRTPPTSAVTGLPASNPPAFTVYWSGSDAVSGIGGYDIEYQQDDGAWQRWLTGVTETSATFSGSSGHSYGFRSRATDMAGNVEAWPPSPDAITTVGEQDIEPPIINWVAPVGDGEIHNVNGETVTLKVTATDNVGVGVVEFWRWDHPTQESVIIGFDNSEPYTVQVNTSEFTNDWNYTYAHAIDESGNQSGDAYIWLFYEPEAGSTPPPPQNLSASDGTLIGQVRITWTQSEGATYYELYRSEPGSSDKVYVHTREGQYDFTDDNNGDGTVLEYALKACSEAGCSEFSNFDTGYADMPVLQSIDNADEDGNYSVSWIPANTASHHELQESQDGGAWTEIYSGDETSITRTGKADGQWCYRVRGYNGIQDYSPWTNPQCTNVGEIDTVQPEVDWLLPVTNEGTYYTFGNEQIQLKVQATDNQSVDVVKFSRYDSVNDAWITIGEDTTAPYQIVLDADSLRNGYNQINAWAFDASGNGDTQFIWVYLGIASGEHKSFVPVSLNR